MSFLLICSLYIVTKLASIHPTLTYKVTSVCPLKEKNCIHSILLVWTMSSLTFLCTQLCQLCKQETHSTSLVIICFFCVCVLILQMKFEYVPIAEERQLTIEFPLADFTKYYNSLVSVVKIKVQKFSFP